MALDPKWTTPEMVSALEELESTTRRPAMHRHIDKRICVTCTPERGPDTRPFYGPAAPVALRKRPTMSAADSMAIGDWLDDHGVPLDAR
jgi:hypothetical protein